MGRKWEMYRIIVVGGKVWKIDVGKENSVCKKFSKNIEKTKSSCLWKSNSRELHRLSSQPWRQTELPMKTMAVEKGIYKQLQRNQKPSVCQFESKQGGKKWWIEGGRHMYYHYFLGSENLMYIFIIKSGILGRKPSVSEMQ